MTSYLLHENQKNINHLTNQLKIPHGTNLSIHQISNYDLVIPWGTNQSFNYYFYTLNKSAANISGSKEAFIHQYKLLNLHGVKSPISVDPYTKHTRIKKVNYKVIYQVAVFQQKVVGFFRKKNKQQANWVNKNIFQEEKTTVYEEVGSLRTKREERRVRQLAIKGIYALNLDFGMVTIGVAAGEIPWLLKVEPYPDLTNRTAAIFGKAIQEFVTQWKHEINTWNPNVVLGTDPEFLLQNQNGEMVLASKFLTKKGRVGCDQIWTNHDRSQLPIAELRPLPSPSPRQLTVNLYKTMLLASKKIKDRQLLWLAGALPIEGFPIGGHIHFSNLWLNSFLLRALDNYLTLTITLFEDPRGIGRRPKYGFVGDYREQFHGGFEYRTPPSWLVSSALTKGVFALSKLITENYIYLHQNPLENYNIQEAYYNGKKDVLRPIVKKLWTELKQLKGYSLYKEYLDPLETMINKEYQWDELIDIRRSWKLPPYHPKTKR